MVRSAVDYFSIHALKITITVLDILIYLNPKTMKKKVFIFAAFLLLAAGITSCEDLFENCKICRLNTYEDGQLINTAQEAEYCGAELVTIQATPPATVGNTTSQWECD